MTTGQRQDAGTGLVLFPGRAYDPSLGRFLQADPFVQDPADPQSLNRYAYVRNNPTNLVDPSGYKFRWKKFFKKVVAAIAGHAARQLVDPEGQTLLGAATQRGTQEATQAALNQERGVGRAFAHGAASGAATYVSTAVTAGVFAITGDAALAYQAGQATTAVAQHQIDDLLMPSAYAGASEREAGDSLIHEKRVREALRVAKEKTNLGTTSAHEEGGYILRNPSGGIGIRALPSGQGSSLAFRLYSNGRIGSSQIVGSYHTHPNTGPGWVQGPSPRDIANSIYFPKTFGSEQFIISELSIFRVDPSGSITDAGDTRSVLYGK